MMLLILLAARFFAWDQVRAAYFGHGGYNAQIAAGPEGVHIGFRRTRPEWRLTIVPPQWHWSRIDWPFTKLSSLCCADHDWWILPGLWIGAGRQGFGDYFDVILPNWLALPLCLLFPRAVVPPSPSRARAAAI
jgi:hypothetical protein